jgi:hypothetical protein
MVLHDVPECNTKREKVIKPSIGILPKLDTVWKEIRSRNYIWS